MRAIRGATTVKTNSASEIYEATEELFQTILKVNEITETEQLVSVMITVTEDLNAAFPAQAIRTKKGFELVPVMSVLEITVPDALKRCIRMMVHTNLDKKLAEIHHIYLYGATKLRPDLVRGAEKK